MADPHFLGLAPQAIDMLARNAARVRMSGNWVNGRWVWGTSERATIRAVIQPVTPETLEQLPEGHRAEADVAIWSRSEIRGDGREPSDRIEADGKRWKVLQVWHRIEADFYKAVAGRIDEPLSS